MTELHNRISQSFEQLAFTEIEGKAPLIFDVLIIGSGYGGSIAAASLAKTDFVDKLLRIAVLERGLEYSQGSFPSTLSELPPHMRWQSNSELGGVSTGLFDIRYYKDVSILQANGLGGGSLINAGVMEEPVQSVFDSRWPSELRDKSVLSNYYESTLRLLGATQSPVSSKPNTVKEPLEKNQYLRKLAGNECYKDAKITVALEDKQNSAGVWLNKCIQCGDCATGCNYNAKDSLDKSLLRQSRYAGVEIYTGVTLQKIKPCISNGEEMYELETLYTDKAIRQKHSGPTLIYARKIILAAGALGSTEILLRSKEELKLSDNIGQQFSSNGDMLLSGYNHNTPVNAIANEKQHPANRKIGPTITGIIDCRENEGLLFEEMAVPGSLTYVFSEICATVNCIQTITDKDTSVHINGIPDNDLYALSDAHIKHTSILAAMGEDGSNGIMSLDYQQHKDGALNISCSMIKQHPVFNEQLEKLTVLSSESSLGGKIIANPMWRFLPEELSDFAGGNAVSALTVHPLGGCAMGDTVYSGVVNHLGQVFKKVEGDASAVHKNLVVLDASIIPGALGVNPALTISAVAQRAIDMLIVNWSLEKVDISPINIPDNNNKLPDVAELFKDWQPTKPVVFDIIERLNGSLYLNESIFKTTQVIAEFTFHFRISSIEELVSNEQTIAICKSGVNQQPSKVRLFRPDDWSHLNSLSSQTRESEADSIALFSATIDGFVKVMHQRASKPYQRKMRTLIPWAFNRGLLDIFGSAQEGKVTVAKLKFLRQLLNNLARSGEERVFIYDLKIDSIQKDETSFVSEKIVKNNQIKGRKTFTYKRVSSPWQQLMELQIDKFPALDVFNDPQMMYLDPVFLSRQSLPLLGVAEAQDSLYTLQDIFRLMNYFLRASIGIHLFSFRKPDQKMHPVEVKRLPGALPNLPEPEIYTIDLKPTLPTQLQSHKQLSSVVCRLTRYRKHKMASEPILMIHGYSASGTTFAHPAINNSYSSYFAKKEYDVWVLDLRTSTGFTNTAMYPWSFEHIACADIPAAIELVVNVTKFNQVQVIAHCMGSAMFSMAILGSGKTIEEIFNPLDKALTPIDYFQQARVQLPSRVKSLVMSQVSSHVKYTPNNIFKTHVLQSLSHIFSDITYLLVPDVDANVDKFPAANNLMDRLLYSLPYPANEYKQSHSIVKTLVRWRLKTYLKTRHRIDFLYGRVFSLKNMGSKALDNIENFFGPFHLGTLFQVLHFFPKNHISNRFGHNVFVLPELFYRHWRFPTYYFIGEENGLFSPESVELFQRYMKQFGRDIQIKKFANYGHQDCVFGDKNLPILNSIEQFFRQSVEVEQDNQELQWVAEPCLYGPIRTMVRSQSTLDFMCSATMQVGEATYVVAIPIKLNNTSITSNCDKSMKTWSVELIKSELKYSECVSTNKHFWATQQIKVEDNSGDWLIFLVNDLCFDLSQQVKDFNAIQLYCAKSIKEAIDKTPHLIHSILRYKLTSASTELSFIVGSCQYQPTIMDLVPAWSSYQSLAEHLDSQSTQVDFMLLLGDQIYSDATNGLMDPINLEDKYAAKYRMLFSNRHVQRVLGQVPVQMMPDDHEFINDWEPMSDNDEVMKKIKQEGLKYYNYFQQTLYQRERIKGKGLWYSWEYHNHAFFMLDSRTERQHRHIANMYRASMLSEAQITALRQWMQDNQHNDNIKIICSASMLLPRRVDAVKLSPLHSDSWDGYPATRELILDMIVEFQLSNLIFISGDEHLGLVAEITLSKGNNITSVLSVHTPALYAPVNFVNTKAKDLILEDVYVTAGNTKVEVSTHITQTQSSYSYMNIFKDNENKYKLSVTYKDGKKVVYSIY